MDSKIQQSEPKRSDEIIHMEDQHVPIDNDLRVSSQPVDEDHIITAASSAPIPSPSPEAITGGDEIKEHKQADDDGDEGRLFPKPPPIKKTQPSVWDEDFRPITPPVVSDSDNDLHPLSPCEANKDLEMGEQLEKKKAASSVNNCKKFQLHLVSDFI